MPIPPVRPSNGQPGNETILYVNGISTDKAGQLGNMQSIANATGANVIGIHNSTQGALKDLVGDHQLIAGHFRV